MKKIAVTGGIAEGKTTVLDYCREAGFATLSADEVARQVSEDEQVQSEISILLGLPRPATREEVRSKMASSSHFRRELNRITHPRINAVLHQSDAEIIEVPLLIEASLQGEFDRVWVVTCGADEQMRRLIERTGADLAAKLLASQLPTCAKTPFADRIIRTNTSRETVKRYVLAIVKSDLGGSRSA